MSFKHLYQEGSYKLRCEIQHFNKDTEFHVLDSTMDYYQTKKPIFFYKRNKSHGPQEVMSLCKGWLQDNCLLVKLMALFGLNFDPRSIDKKCIHSILSIVIVVMMNVFIILIILYFTAYYYTHIENFQKGSLTLALSMAINLFLWHKSFNKRREIRRSVKLLLMVNPNSLKRKLFSEINAVTSILFTMPAVCTMQLWYHGSQNLEFSKSIVAFCQKIGLPEETIYVAVFFMYYFGCVTQNILVLYCAILFQDLGQSVLRCKENLLQEGGNLTKVFRHYKKILICKTSIEETFSGFLLAVTFLGFLNVFGAFTLLLGFETGEWASRKYVYSAIIYSVVNFVLVLYLMFAAAGVHEKDKSFRNAVNLYYLKSSRRSDCYEPNFDIAISESESIAFSVFGYFKFTKGFILTSIGTLLTYSLLINQLQNS
ncbi:hypothetical protein TNCT_526771 [Trichonephila clavata]|uniref:Gustatory receptor n=1 Tax=Trichonephila clavata TaxID=2740835 RepID=A0A8X6FW33_TRICU|nr:hypothetical protein TNCT_526771 [Trichonephila clavata]